MPDRLVSVAVPVPALGLLTYRVPADQPMPVRGARVVVPLGTRTLTGVVVGAAPAPPTHVELQRHSRGAGRRGVRAGRRASRSPSGSSDYYLAGPGAALAAALPPHGLHRARRFASRRSASRN